MPRQEGNGLYLSPGPDIPALCVCVRVCVCVVCVCVCVSRRAVKRCILILDTRWTWAIYGLLFYRAGPFDVGPRQPGPVTHYLLYCYIFLYTHTHIHTHKAALCVCVFARHGFHEDCLDHQKIWRKMVRVMNVLWQKIMIITLGLLKYNRCNYTNLACS